MRRLLLLVIIASFIGNWPTLAGTPVEFPNLPGREPGHLTGYLARPGAGLSALIGTTPGDAAPYPAVVVLHGCGGISSHSAAIADRLGGWGYVALAIDTLGPRGMDSGCYSGTFVDQAFRAALSVDAEGGVQVTSTRFEQSGWLQGRRRETGGDLWSIDGRRSHALRNRSQHGRAIF